MKVSPTKNPLKPCFLKIEISLAEEIPLSDIFTKFSGIISDKLILFSISTSNVFRFLYLRQ